MVTRREKLRSWHNLIRFINDELRMFADNANAFNEQWLEDAGIYLNNIDDVGIVEYAVIDDESDLTIYANKSELLEFLNDFDLRNLDDIKIWHQDKEIEVKVKIELVE